MHTEATGISSSRPSEIVWDASVVKAPFSGVHYSVCEELSALLQVTTGKVFCSDETLHRQVASTGAGALPAPSAPWRRILWQQFQFPGLLRASGARLLHALAYTAPLRCPLPVVLNVHDIIALEHPELCSYSNLLHMRLLLPESIRRAACNVVSTKHVAERLRDVLQISDDKIRVVPLGVDCRRFASVVETSRIHERPYFLFVSNLEPKKGLPTLLDAYARVAEDCGHDLVIVGRAGWRCRQVVRQIESWSGPGRVCWLGRVPDDRLVALYQQASALIFPSLAEGFGMPVLEAMAAGAAVIHSDHPAVVEAAGGAGLSCPRGDATALARKLRTFCQSGELRGELREKGLLRARDATWEKWARLVVEIYQGIC